MRKLNDEEKAERNRRQMTDVLAGLDRAVEWLKQNRDKLVGGFMLIPDKKHGIQIALGDIWNFDNDPKATAHIKELFGGKTVQRQMCRDREERFRLEDDELSLVFTWSIHHPEPAQKNETDEVVI